MKNHFINFFKKKEVFGSPFLIVFKIYKLNIYSRVNIFIHNIKLNIKFLYDYECFFNFFTVFPFDCTMCIFLFIYAKKGH